MKFTPEQRIEAYEYASDNLALGRNYICNELIRWVRKYTMEKEVDFAADFPEFWAQRPKDASYAWWPTNNESYRQQRIGVLNKAIALAKLATE